MSVGERENWRGEVWRRRPLMSRGSGAAGVKGGYFQPPPLNPDSMTAEETGEKRMSSGVKINSRNGDGIQVTLFNNIKRIVVRFASTAGLDRTIEGDILKLYVATLAKDDDEDEDEKDKAFHDVQALVLDAGILTFA